LESKPKNWLAARSAANQFLGFILLIFDIKNPQEAFLRGEIM
jgi:hypothetical protein